jgi:rare lipoprotein A
MHAKKKVSGLFSATSGKINLTPFFLAVLCCLSGCGLFVEKDRGPAAGSVDVSGVGDAVPRDEPKSRYGNPESYEVFGKRYYVMQDARGYRERGIASWYGEKFHGRRTSNGESYDMYAMTAAHKTLPLPTYVEVTNLKNGRRVILRVNDRGPFHDNRIIDLSYTAAAKLDILAAGTGLVEVRAIDPKDRSRPAAPVVTSAPASGSAGFYIQIGAFSLRLNAEKLLEKLGPAIGTLARVSEATVDGRKLYRVRVGPLYDVDAADRIVAGLEQLGIVDHRVVTD